ncbi:alpha/beta hydrolase [Ferviditalea candida]|uniref:Alpha/beta fold hydrolase n=1 Tax=Ferviditalea candida TaxID=3108399 RepID=A0ABU5ZJN1_9BACL|nr:alpha/beta fold hydrolase [Paenibacillaceae bacterium T2]
MPNSHQSYPKVCLLLHGFTGGPFEVEPLGSHLQSKGYTVSIPVLPGHAGDDRHLGEVTWQQWVEEAEREAGRLAETYGSFDLAGFSMGGLIAAYLASRYPVRRLVLISASVIYLSPKRFATEMWEEVRRKNWSAFYKVQTTPLHAVLQFMMLVRSLRREIGRVQVPTLVVQGERDEIVHPYSARYLEQNLGGEVQVKYFSNSRHLIFLDIETKEVCEAISAFYEGDDNEAEKKIRS